jgi:hypothetical protein
MTRPNCTWATWVPLVCAGIALAQTPEVPKPIPRTSDGHPDLAGVWQVVDLVGSLYMDKSPIPFTPAGEAAFKSVQDVIDPLTYCLPPGVPRIMNASYPMQFVQTPAAVTILYEAFHQYRWIPFKSTPHQNNPEPTFMGDSTAAWDGDTLVVDMTNPLGDIRTWLDGAKHPHSGDLHVIERFTRTDYGHLKYEVTIDDPKYYTRPWSPRPRILNFKPDWRIFEYVCEENNKDIQHAFAK